MLLTYSTDRERYEVRADYSERGPIQLAGFWWSATTKTWCSKDPERANYLKASADGPTWERLEAWAATRNAEIEASRATSSDTVVRAPMGLSYLPFQVPAIDYARRRQVALLADEMGVGKTIESIGVLNSLPRDEALPCLVVCPATPQINWQRELEKWLVHDAEIGIATSKWVPDRDVVIVSYSILAKILPQLAARRWKVIIADEAHKAKSLRHNKEKGWHGTQRAMALRTLTERVTLRGGRALFLTGTPLDRPQDLWALLAMLKPDTWPERSFFSFGLRYAAGKRTRWGWDFSGSSNTDELQRKLRSLVMVRRTKDEVMDYLPAKTRQVVRLEPEVNDLLFEVRAHDELKQTLDYDQAMDQLVKPSRKEFLERISKLRADTAMRKAPRVVDFCKDLLETEQKIIVFATHTAIIEYLRKELKLFKPVTLTGSTPVPKRAKVVDEFQTGKARVFIGNMEAAGTAITLTAAHCVVFAELDWQPSVMRQAEDRAHRIGQSDNVLVYYVVLDGSIDARLAEVLLTKQETFTEAIDTRKADRQAMLF